MWASAAPRSDGSGTRAGTGPSSGSAPRIPPAQPAPPPPETADSAAGRPPPSTETPLGFGMGGIEGGSGIRIRAGLGRGGGLGLTGNGQTQQVAPWQWKPWEDWSEEGGERKVERGGDSGKTTGAKAGFRVRDQEGCWGTDQQNRYRVCRPGVKRRFR